MVLLDSSVNEAMSERIVKILEGYGVKEFLMLIIMEENDGKVYGGFISSRTDDDFEKPWIVDYIAKGFPSDADYMIKWGKAKFIHHGRELCEVIYDTLQRDCVWVLDIFRHESDDVNMAGLFTNSPTWNPIKLFVTHWFSTYKISQEMIPFSLAKH